MEHEDNTQMNFLQNSQNYVENMQNVAGGNVAIGDVGNFLANDEIVAGIGSNINIGGKFEELDEHDDEELKYIKEVQQTEKQQTNKKNVDGVEAFGFSNANGNGCGDENFGQYKNILGNGNVDVLNTNSAASSATIAASESVVGFINLDEEDVEIIKNDGDFSTTSTTTSTVGEDVEPDVLQVEMKIDIAEQQQQNQQHEELQQQQQNYDVNATAKEDDVEEEDPSSMATTNGTSSLSENAPYQHQMQQQLLEVDQEAADNYHEQEQQLQQEPEYFAQQEDFENDGKNIRNNIMNIENKEQADSATMNIDTCQIPSVHIDFETHSQLNPDAKEFVPSFGSNPTSPTSPIAAVISDNVGEPVNVGAFDAQFTQPHPNAVSLHLFDNDAVIAESPRKGRGINIDAIPIPGETEFTQEISKRPHELEADDDLMCNVSNNSIQDLGEIFVARDSSENLIDHGPETSVDLDMDINQIEAVDNVMKPSVDMENILNSVQPLPTDTNNLNMSFIEEPEIERTGTAEKDLFLIEDNDFISQSHFMEEAQKNMLHNDDMELHITLDMNNVAHMQESFYVEHTSADSQQQEQLALQQQQQQEEREYEKEAILQPTESGDEHFAQEKYDLNVDNSLLADTTNPLECNVSAYESTFDALETITADSNDQEFIAGNEAYDNVTGIAADAFRMQPPQDLCLYNDFKQKSLDDVTPSPFSTEEKHLIEDTKEQLIATTTTTTTTLGDCNTNKMDQLEKSMEDLQLGSNDGTLEQVEEVVQYATTITENANDFFKREFEPQYDEPMHDQSVPEHQYEPFETRSEQISQNEQLLQQLNDDVNDIEASHVNTYDQEVPGNTVFVETAEEAAAPSVCISEEVAAEIPLAEEAAPLTPTPTAVETAPTPTVEEVAAVFPTTAAAVEATLPPAAVPPEAPAEMLDVAADIPIVDAILPQETAEEAATLPLSSDAGIVAAAAAATTAIVAGAAAATVVAASKKTTQTSKSTTTTTTTSNRAKLVDAKKPAETKKPMTIAAAAKSTSATTAKPRTLTASKTPVAGAADKKPIVTATAKSTSAGTKAPIATIAKKPLGAAATTTAKTITKTTTTTTTAARPATAPSSTADTKTSAAASRTTTTTARVTRKPATSATAATNGSAASNKSRPATAGATTTAPNKPTSLGLTATTKPKLPAPRPTLASQLRKTAPATSNTTSVKSPTKAATGTASATTTATSRTKTGAATTTTATTTKTFTARPAPRTTDHSIMSVTKTTTTTSRRTTLNGGLTVAAANKQTGLNGTNSSPAQRKSSPLKPTSNTAAAAGKLSPSKNPSSKVGGLKSKTKEVNKTGTKSTADAALKKKKQDPIQANGSTITTTTETTTAAIPPAEVAAAAINNDVEKLQHYGDAQENGTGDAHNAANGVHADLLLEQQPHVAEVALIDA